MKREASWTRVAHAHNGAHKQGQRKRLSLKNSFVAPYFIFT